MPFVNVKVAGSLSKDQKREIGAQISKVLFDVAGKNPSSTYVVIDEIEQIERDSWTVGESLLSDN